MSESEVIRSCSTFQHPLIHTFTYIHIHADKVPTLCLNRAGPSPLQCSAPGPLLCEQSWWAALSHQVSHTQEFVFLHESRSGLFSLYLACKLPWSCSAVEMCSAIDHTRWYYLYFITYILQARYIQAKLSVHDRSLKVATVIESLEMEMELLCLTGVEDQLQTDVRPTLEILRNAGIKVWAANGLMHAAIKQN